MKISRNLFRPLPIALAVVLSFSSQVRAQSLVTLYEIAREYDASFISAKAQYEANLAKANQTLGGILPNISLGSTATRTNATISYDKAPSSNGENTFGVYSANVTMTQPLYRPAVWATYKQGVVSYYLQPHNLRPQNKNSSCGSRKPILIYCPAKTVLNL